eukprot:TRINITY_DN16804_c0_g1_i1.p1 TRINITY_DN16804_c0_g1~~TRINITY_DN16804_c0_g1_i1.p1  ORF type:complete len:194 (+),score=22.46 TRINITY_DN16804_c0_g1_i1:45-626(+)
MARCRGLPSVFFLTCLSAGCLHWHFAAFVQWHANPADGALRKQALDRRSSVTLLGTLLADARAAHAAAIEPENDWLVIKRMEPDVVTLPSGLMYKVLEQGLAGGPSPTLTQKCDVTYAGQLTNGKQFDAGTTQFAPNQVIKGWTEAMQLMKEGDKWELYIPSRLAYGDRGIPSATIKPGASLVFQMKINKVLS